MTTVAGLLDRGESHARRVLLDRGEKSLAPLFHLLAPDPSNDRVISVSWRNELEKQIVLLGIKEAAQEIGAVAVLVMSESWMLKLKTEPTSWHARRALDRAGPPSQSPDRIEVVSIAASDGDERGIRLLQIVRDKPGGRIVALVAEADSGHTAESRFLDVLPRRPSTGDSHD